MARMLRKASDPIRSLVVKHLSPIISPPTLMTSSEEKYVHRITQVSKQTKEASTIRSHIPLP
jgi:hypothetical protein